MAEEGKPAVQVKEEILVQLGVLSFMADVQEGEGWCGEWYLQESFPNTFQDVPPGVLVILRCLSRPRNPASMIQLSAFRKCTFGQFWLVLAHTLQKVIGFVGNLLNLIWSPRCLFLMGEGKPSSDAERTLKKTKIEKEDTDLWSAAESSEESLETCISCFVSMNGTHKRVI